MGKDWFLVIPLVCALLAMPVVLFGIFLVETRRFDAVGWKLFGVGAAIGILGISIASFSLAYSGLAYVLRQ